MFLRHKFAVIFIISALFSGPGLLHAAWWERGALPIPVETQETKKETRRLFGSEFEYIYYTSALDRDSLKDFYRQRLTALGWKEKETFSNFKQNSEIKISPAAGEALSRNIIFEKEGEMVILSFVPEGIAQDAKTRFVLARGKLNVEAQPQGKDFSSELIAKPKKNIAPVYPGATLLNLSEQPNFSMAVYSSKDDLESVAAFYKQKMLDYGWSLAAETPLKKIYSGASGLGALAKQCPACAQKQEVVSAMKATEVFSKELTFTNTKEDTCKIGLSRTELGKSIGDEFNATGITVNYVQKRK